MGAFDEFPLPVRLFLHAYPWRRIDPVPWAPLRKPLTQCRVALVTSAAYLMPGQQPFDYSNRGGDPTFRYIPGDADVAGLTETQPSDHFDHTGMREDGNLAFPLDRLRDLAAEGRIGSVAPRHLSLCGAMLAPGRMVRETAPVAARTLVEDGVDVALLVPV